MSLVTVKFSCSIIPLRALFSHDPYFLLPYLFRDELWIQLNLLASGRSRESHLGSYLLILTFKYVLMQFKNSV